MKYPLLRTMVVHKHIASPHYSAEKGEKRGLVRCFYQDFFRIPIENLIVMIRIVS
jgi:hypothetical protein